MISPADMLMKRCTRCGLVKPTARFAFRDVHAARRQSWCRACHSTCDRSRYRSLTPEARERRRRSDRARNAEIGRKLDELMAATGCVDCGITDPIVLEFDHVGAKTANVSAMALRASWPRVLEEISRCEVRCVNCHKRMTAARRRLQRTE